MGTLEVHVYTVEPLLTIEKSLYTSSWYYNTCIYVASSTLDLFPEFLLLAFEVKLL